METETLSGFGWRVRAAGDHATWTYGTERRTRRLLREAIGRTDGLLQSAAPLLCAAALAGFAIFVASILSAEVRPAPFSLARAIHIEASASAMTIRESATP
jgi:hypothetical protein